MTAVVVCCEVTPDASNGVQPSNPRTALTSARRAFPPRQSGGAPAAGTGHMLLPSASEPVAAQPHALPGPRGAHRGHAGLERLAATAERGAQRVELLAQIARTDGADDPPA